VRQVPINQNLIVENELKKVKKEKKNILKKMKMERARKEPYTKLVECPKTLSNPNFLSIILNSTWSGFTVQV